MRGEADTSVLYRKAAALALALAKCSGMVPRVTRLLLISLAASSLLLGGCKGPCRTLAEKLCDCEATSLLRESCLREASQEESRVSPTVEQEAQCEALIEQCDCNSIETTEGKRACGLAR